MSGYGSLFERLSGDANMRDGWSREVSAMASVAAHLAKMLSTRAGSVQTLSDYGLPDLNDMRLSLHDSLSQARLAIENFIEAYEPRLSNVRVIPCRVTTISFGWPSASKACWKSKVSSARSVSARLDGSGQVKVT
jgi:type VI secretion system protein